MLKNAENFPDVGIKAQPGIVDLYAQSTKFLTRQTFISDKEKLKKLVRKPMNILLQKLKKQYRENYCQLWDIQKKNCFEF